MKKIVLTLAALAAVSTSAFAGTAFEKQIQRNMIENPENYTFPMVSGSAVSSSDALAVFGSTKGLGRTGSIKFGPGEDGNHRR
jgi:hypothetical protein